MKGILGIVVIAEDTTAYAPDHTTVPLHEGFEGRLFPAADETLQKLPVGQVRAIPQQSSSAKVLDDLAQVTGCHLVLFVVDDPLPYYYRQVGNLMRYFSKAEDRPDLALAGTASLLPKAARLYFFFHKRIVLSSPAEASRLPSRLKATVREN